jgi:hypothetical protein
MGVGDGGRGREDTENSEATTSTGVVVANGRSQAIKSSTSEERQDPAKCRKERSGGDGEGSGGDTKRGGGTEKVEKAGKGAQGQPEREVTEGGETGEKQVDGGGEQNDLIRE